MLLFQDFSEQVQLPLNKRLGSSGREISLLTNHFEMKIHRELTLFHYDVTIEQPSRRPGGKPIVWTIGKAHGYVILRSCI